MTSPENTLCPSVSEKVYMLDVQIRAEILKRLEPQQKPLEETREIGGEGTHWSKEVQREEIHPAGKKGKTGNTWSNLSSITVQSFSLDKQ